VDLLHQRVLRGTRWGSASWDPPPAPGMPLETPLHRGHPGDAPEDPPAPGMPLETPRHRGRPGDAPGDPEAPGTPWRCPWRSPSTGDAPGDAPSTGDAVPTTHLHQVHGDTLGAGDGDGLGAVGAEDVGARGLGALVVADAGVVPGGKTGGGGGEVVEEGPARGTRVLGPHQCSPVEALEDRQRDALVQVLDLAQVPGEGVEEHPDVLRGRTAAVERLPRPRSAPSTPPAPPSTGLTGPREVRPYQGG